MYRVSLLLVVKKYYDNANQEAKTGEAHKISWHMWPEFSYKN